LIIIRIGLSQNDGVIVVKHFNIPESYPFDVSDRLFEIRYNEKMEELSNQEVEISKHEVKSLNNNIAHSTLTLAFENKNPHGPNTSVYFGTPDSTSGFGTIQSTSAVDTYYIYSFDGKLMAEYDHNGNCVKDYIYAGNRLIAEYQPQANKYYYYMSDQINSTRIVTDDNGNVVYSEAYNPFGGVQKNWTKAYDPKLKFSSKEREAYGDLDYFGARYYDHNSYRFISVDPIINKGEAISNPQLWNLYSYCRNNPITFIDPIGMADINIFLAPNIPQLSISVDQAVGGKMKVPVPNFLALSNSEHTVHMMPFTISEFKSSLNSDNTWTFFIGHSIHNSEGSFYAMLFNDGFLSEWGVPSLNDYVGVFACNSSEYASYIVMGFDSILFSIKEKHGDLTDIRSLAIAAYKVIQSLIEGDSISKAAERGTSGLNLFNIPINKGDETVFEKQ